MDAVKQSWAVCLHLQADRFQQLSRRCMDVNAGEIMHRLAGENMHQ